MAVDYKPILLAMSKKPGVYMFVDQNGTIIYVGKAKNLKQRVTSYFAKNQSGKTTVMLKRAVNIKHIVVNTEEDALLLENNMIKEYQPRYNILLKDDKTYPWICVKNENYPRVFLTRNYIKDGSTYFGPYTSTLMARTLLDLIRKLYQLRSCNLNLTPDGISSGKFKVCLEYHIGNCKAPCIGLQTKEEYDNGINQIKNILKGNISTVKEHLKEMMKRYAGEMRFEEAHAVKDKLDILSGFQLKSTIVGTVIRNVDVFGIAEDDSNTYVNYLKVVNGAVIQVFTLSMKSIVAEEKESLLSFAITEIRKRVSSDSPEIIVPFKPDMSLEGIKYTVPEKGDKLRLLELAGKNALYFKLEQMKRREVVKPKDRTSQILEKMKADFQLPDLPVHIECFDNSNIMGTYPVAACVVFRNGKPSKKEYRHFNIKSVEGPNDFASMEEIVYRRYKRLMEEKRSLPQLIIVDGGKGQLSSAVKSLTRLGLENKVVIVGIAKRLEEIFFPNDPVPLYIDKNTVSLKIVQQLRDEAHRFGITFHRDKRSVGMVGSELDNIKGIGPKTKELLLSNLGSVAIIRNTPVEKIMELIGVKKSLLLSEYFNNNPTKPSEF
jgi:excinuclease ABC subunit C